MGFEKAGNWNVYAPDGRRKYLDARERRAFLAAAEEEPELIQALCWFLVLCGCRVSEALAVTAEHIDRSANNVVIRTLKRRKLAFRQVPLPKPLVAKLVRLSGKGGPIWPVHRVTAWRWVTRVMERAGIDGPMACCRGARHGFAIHAATKSVPPGLLKKWLGHASLATTVIYMDAVGVEEREFASRMW